LIGGFSAFWQFCGALGIIRPSPPKSACVCVPVAHLWHKGGAVSSLEEQLHLAEKLLGHVPPEERVRNVDIHWHAKRAHRYTLSPATQALLDDRMPPVPVHGDVPLRVPSTNALLREQILNLLAALDIQTVAQLRADTGSADYQVRDAVHYLVEARCIVKVPAPAGAVRALIAFRLREPGGG
jgi:hypothetical protein